MGASVNLCHKQSLLYWTTIIAFLLVGGTQGLVPPLRTSLRYGPHHGLFHKSHCEMPRSILISAKGQGDDPFNAKVVNYNDDAFGLVFLCGAFVAQDIVFSATFMIVSGVGALLTKQGQITFSNQIPPIVAVCSLLLASLFSIFLQDISWIPTKSESAWQVESIVCSLSVLYGFVLSPLISQQR